MNIKAETERRLKQLRLEKLQYKRTYTKISPEINKNIEYYAEVLKQLNNVRVQKSGIWGLSDSLDIISDYEKEYIGIINPF